MDMERIMFLNTLIVFINIYYLFTYYSILKHKKSLLTSSVLKYMIFLISLVTRNYIIYYLLTGGKVSHGMMAMAGCWVNKI